MTPQTMWNCPLLVNLNRRKVTLQKITTLGAWFKQTVRQKVQTEMAVKVKFIKI